MELQIIEHSLRDVTHRLWAESLGLEALPDLSPDEVASHGAVRGARVTIAGAWDGCVVVEMSESLAHAVARKMFDLGTGSASESDIDDCMKEIANITAGNLKTSLPEPCTLSIPKPFHESKWGGDIRKSEHSAPLIVNYECHGEPFRIVVARQ